MLFTEACAPQDGELRYRHLGTGWAPRVRTITVEVHEPYTIAECERDLRALGFTTRADPRHWACVVGVRTTEGPL